MGGAICPRRGDVGTLVPTEYEWDGIATDRIDAYYDAQLKMFEENQEKYSLNADDPQWLSKVPPEALGELRGLLVRRAVALVHVLRPIEESRRGYQKLRNAGMMAPDLMSSFDRAEALCSEELTSIKEETQRLFPDAGPMMVIQMGVRLYDEHGLNWTPTAAPPETDEVPAPFTLGQKVRWASSDDDVPEGEVGEIVGGKGAHVRVKFAKGTWAFDATMLRDTDGKQFHHPDAEEEPVVYVRLAIPREPREPTGLVLKAVPANQQTKTNAHLLVEKVEETGCVPRFNEQQEDADLKIRAGDRLVGVMDGSVPESKRRPVQGDCAAMESLVAKATPLMVSVERPLGPPLRFQVGQVVKANCGPMGWVPGIIVGVWEEGGRKPYAVRLIGKDRVVFAPTDSDVCVIRGDARFEVGQKVMANRSRGYEPGVIVAVTPTKTSYSYRIKCEDGEECVAPTDLNQYVRAVARFKKGTKVLAKISDSYVPGVIEAVNHPQWVYLIKLRDGNVVTAPEDEDSYIKLDES
eukprot:TRINITY_DN45406_c0_g1_i1.p1 TRINITY_DN45406_c0_g1~~TRINITY_DN45406_c0_g1_i1.p1  ORF type:complete len:521 (-),score=96.41 TRINITY_DN45406_c0_g1_i1:250-1812(-)